MHLFVFKIGFDIECIQLTGYKDLRNHGDSPHDPVHNYLAMAEDVEDFFREHGLEKPTMIGHSMLVHASSPYPALDMTERSKGARK